MKIITKIEVQKKNSKRCSIFINEEFAFGIDIDALGMYDIQKGNSYTEEEYEELLKKLQYEKSKFAALRYVGYSPRTIQQTVEKLHTLEFDEMIIEKTIDFLKSYSYLDDAAYVNNFIRSRIKQKRHGRHKITYDLLRRGISKDMCQPVLDEYEEEEYEAALYLYHKRTKGKIIKDYKEKSKITRYLQGRGYPFDIIRAVMEEGSQDYD